LYFGVLPPNSLGIKARRLAETIKEQVGKDYSETCDDVRADRKYIVYGGDGAFPLGRGATMISLRKLMQLITA
jgi:hypothetical protein